MSPGQFDVFDFLAFTVSKWRFLAVAIGAAMLAAAAAGWFLTPRYTAVASILIEAPGGLDPRAATAVSPVYLESLRTYEHFASSDSLFARAIERLGIREQYRDVPLESLKARVLKVSKPSNTKILEIRVTLEDPKKAQALAQFMAEETVSLSGSLDQPAGDRLVEEARGRVQDAKARVGAADRELAREASQGPDLLRSQMEAAADLEAQLRRDLAESQADLAGILAQERAASPSDRDRAAGDVAALRARIADLHKQLASAEAAAVSKQALLGKREVRMNNLRQEQKSARTELDASVARLNEMTASAGFRSERLKIIDPGIVPERPSAPNRPLLVIAAMLISAVLSLIYIAFAFRFRRPRVRERERTLAFG